MKIKLTALIALLPLLLAAGQPKPAIVTAAYGTNSAPWRFKVAQELGTNWTDHYWQETNRIGFVVTNTYGVVVFEGRTNQMLLKSERSGIAVWSPTVRYWTTATNWWTNMYPLTLTNLTIPAR